MLAAWSGDGSPWFLVFPLFWLTAIVVLAFVFRRHRWGHRHDASEETVLGERYARGEITEQEYRQRLSVLREGSR